MYFAIDFRIYKPKILTIRNHLFASLSSRYFSDGLRPLRNSPSPDSRTPNTGFRLFLTAISPLLLLRCLINRHPAAF
ncbi:hypothetical protein D0T92_07075 [Neisseria zalophi]|uniref:Uncharacterized protein n=1 Tax=Neisseria zalophi TaxID=640030 RepID=A0A5J6PUT3_9NEIS|nr:hypothetical protein D0T92_07075 [Neisseria zalophi]